MIVKRVKGDILKAPVDHIVFGVNTEGHNDAGFAGHIASMLWPELEDMGEKKLGEVFSLKTEDKTFHACVCHSLKVNGWQKTPKVIEECLNKLNIPESETIAMVLIGGGPIGQMQGADTEAILDGIERSEKIVVIYTR